MVPDSPVAGPPVYNSRELPVPSRRAVARRCARLALIFAPRVGPRALSQLRHLHSGKFTTTTLAHPLRVAFERSGGTFVKFGQIIASSPGLFGDALADEFRSCLDTGPTVPFDEIRAVIERDLGGPLSDFFVDFSPTPIGQASIAVVHRARLLNGRDVVVKVLRPGIEQMVAADLDIMEPMMGFVTRQTGAQLAAAAWQQIDGLRQQIGEELDLRNEARALDHFRDLTARSSLNLIAVPEPFPEFSSQNILTMEFLDGFAIDDFSQAQGLGIDPAPLIDQLIRGFFTMTVQWGTFHGDAHAGNLMLLRDGRIGVIDWGIVGRLDAATHRFFVRMLQAVLGEEAAWMDVTQHLLDNYGPALREAMGMTDEQMAQFLRAMIEPILLRPFGEISFADMMTMAQVHVGEANGVSFQQRGWRAMFQRLRLQRKIQRMAEDGGGLMNSFDRGNFLLGKQLMYFERYGRMYLSDRSILADRPFLESLLRDAEPLTA